MNLNPAHLQGAHAVRLEWGPTGATALAPDVDLAVVVDVLSFTTTLSVAVERGMRVFPYRWKDERARAYAAQRQAVLAIGRFEQREAGEGVSLSPAAMARVDGVERIVLPSPNGSAISFALAQGGARVVGASLRNASAVARWLRPQIDDGARLLVVPAGERWPDGTLRPAVEDLWGAGAVISALGVPDLSPEATFAAEAFRAVAPTLASALPACASGAELVAAGFADDVAVAAAHDVSEVVPVLESEVFVSVG